METISPRQALAAEVHNLGISGYAAFSQRLCRFFSAVMPLFHPNNWYQGSYSSISTTDFLQNVVSGVAASSLYMTLFFFQRLHQESAWTHDVSCFQTLFQHTQHTPTIFNIRGWPHIWGHWTTKIQTTKARTITTKIVTTKAPKNRETSKYLLGTAGSPAMEFDAAWDFALAQEQAFLEAWDEAERQFRKKKRHRRKATSDPYQEPSVEVWLAWKWRITFLVLFFWWVFLSNRTCSYRKILE